MGDGQGIDLAGTRVLVTGGTSGLGLAMATALARAGAAVVLTSRSAERAAAAAAGLPGAAGIGADVRDAEAVARLVEQAWSRLGGIDMLVNNAGLGMRTVNPRFMTEPQGFWEVPDEGFRAVLDTNLTGYFLMAREITPRMLAAGAGRIVNISMNHTTMNRRGFVPYGPARAGAEALSRIMAADLRATGITVNILLPGGATDTGMIPAEHRPAQLNFIDPAVMGPPIVWLASAQARGVHDERIVATRFSEWLRDRAGRPLWAGDGLGGSHRIGGGECRGVAVADQLQAAVDVLPVEVASVGEDRELAGLAGVADHPSGPPQAGKDALAIEPMPVPGQPTARPQRARHARRARQRVAVRGVRQYVTRRGCGWITRRGGGARRDAWRPAGAGPTAAC